MDMNYNELLDLLSESFKITHVVTNEDSPEILDIELLSEAGAEVDCEDSSNGNIARGVGSCSDALRSKNWSANTLYVGRLSDLSPGTDPLPPLSILSFESEELPQNLPEGSSFAVIQYEDFFNVFNLAKNLIFEALKSEVILLELIQDIMDGRGILNNINTAARLLGNALILVDAGMNVLAYSTIYDIADPHWAENIKKGRYTYDFIKRVSASKEMNEWNKHGKATQVITLPGDLQPKLVARITRDGHLAGALVMIGHHTPIKHSHFHQLPLVGKTLLDAYKNDAAEDAKTSLISTILYNLLDEDNIAESLELISRSEHLYPEEMRVVVARFTKRVENRYLKRTIRVELERLFPNSHSVQYKSYMAILVPSISNDQKEALDVLAQNEDLALGISWPFTDIIDFKRYFNQSVAAIKQAHRLGRAGRIFDYTDYAFYDLIYNYTGKIPLSQFSHPALKKLRDYDAANNTEFYTTLYTYLVCSKNIRETADALFLHKNSLIYRISRIHQIIGSDLSDTNTLYALMDAFRIEAFMKT